ncbi:DedA family protein [Clostridium pasteurianum]|uniref:DedA family protein n=1 Tax=Clostridium pasteurianum TaxID=1501 RepID=UPI001FA91499|nr:DedA family protein [Clostridium pasteurianum]
MQFIKLLLDEYGYSVLFISLMLELIALPLPGETLMSYCGYLVYIGTLNWTISVILAALGTIIGITISYFIGRTLGIDFLNKFGRYLHIKPESFEKVSKWFEKYGCGILVISYFIPGVRHLTGYFAGITKISLKKIFC